MSIKVDGLAEAVAKVLEEYQDTTIDGMKEAVDKAAKNAVQSLKSDSPRRTGAYSRGWAAKQDKTKNKWAYAKTVYNKDRYRLTHLLEKGHRKVNGGRVAARPHIEKAEQKAIDELVKEIKKL